MPLLVPRGMVLSIFSFSLLMSLVFFWDSDQAGWIRPGLPPPSYDGWSCSTFSEVPSGTPGDIKSLLISASVKGFGGGFGVDIYGSHQLLVSSLLRERDKMFASSHSFRRSLEWLLAW